MEQREVEGIEVDNFPADLLGHPLLAWMGDDYVRFIAVELLQRFRQQDAGTEMLGLRCEQNPTLRTSADETSGKVRGVVVEINLQVLLQASDGRCWRLKGDGRFTATGLDQPGRTSVLVGFDIRSAEQAE